MWNRFLIWLDGYDRKTGTYYRAVSPNDWLKGFLLILFPILVVVISVTVIVTILIVK